MTAEKDKETVRRFVIDIVSDQTGIPKEMITDETLVGDCVSTIVRRLRSCKKLQSQEISFNPASLSFETTLGQLINRIVS